MRGFIAAVLFALALLFALTHYDPDASNRLVIDGHSAPNLHRAKAGNRIEVCEKRQLAGRQHTLNPHAPREKQRQELITVCLEVPADGHPPKDGRVPYTTYRKPMGVA